MHQQIGVMINNGIQLKEPVLRHIRKHGERLIIAYVYRRENLCDIVERELLDVRIIDHITLVVPVRKAVFQRRRKSEKCYSSNYDATEKCAEHVFPCQWLDVVIMVLF
jgi:hypothetical protein